MAAVFFEELLEPLELRDLRLDPPLLGPFDAAIDASSAAMRSGTFCGSSSGVSIVIVSPAALRIARERSLRN